MPRVPHHALTWSAADGLYELCAQGRAERRFRPADEEEWQDWLRSATSFAFRGYFHYGIAWDYYAWDRRPEALSSLDRSLRIARTWQNADLLIVGHHAQAEIAMASGDLTAALQALEQVEELVRWERFKKHAHFVDVTRVRYLLASGDMGAARHWSEHVALDPDTLDPNRWVEVGARTGIPRSAAATTPRSRLSPQAAPASSALVEPLTRREREVLLHLAAGASNQEIAAALVISPATVKKHVGNLLGKLGAESRTQAVARAREQALL